MSKGLKIANAISNEISKNVYSKKGPAKQQNVKSEKEPVKKPAGKKNDTK